MIQENEILKELQEMGSPLARFERMMPYAFPGGYFDTVSDILVQGAQLAAEAEPGLFLSKAMPFAVPEGYFSELPRRLTDMAAASIPATRIELPVDMPQGYFSALPSTLPASAEDADGPAQQQRAVAFRPSWQRRTVQWAVAAMLVLGASLGSYKYFQPAPPDMVAAGQLSQINGDDIDSYIEQQVDDFDTDELEASVIAANSDLKTSVSALEDDEIKGYLYDEPAAGNPNTLN